MKGLMRFRNFSSFFKENVYKRAFQCIVYSASVVCFWTIPVIYTEPFEPTAQYQVYFSPYQNCTSKITQAIHQSKTNIYLQAYSFTSQPILDALLHAKRRGVLVHVILDKSHIKNSKVMQHFKKAGIPVWIDEAQGIAHNKTIIIDEYQVITGSFNFSYAAQHRNKENVLFIKDAALAHRYLDNWHYCKSHAKLMFGKKKVMAPKSVTVQKLLFLLFSVAVLLASGISLAG